MRKDNLEIVINGELKQNNEYISTLIECILNLNLSEIKKQITPLIVNLSDNESFFLSLNKSKEAICRISNLLYNHYEFEGSFELSEIVDKIKLKYNLDCELYIVENNYSMMDVKEKQ